MMSIRLLHSVEQLHSIGLQQEALYTIYSIGLIYLQYLSIVLNKSDTCMYVHCQNLPKLGLSISRCISKIIQFIHLQYKKDSNWIP